MPCGRQKTSSSEAIFWESLPKPGTGPPFCTRPGAAFLAARTGAPLLPIGLDGLTDVFPSLFRGRRAKVTVNIGKPFGPLTVSGSGRERRPQLDEIGHEFMRHTAFQRSKCKTTTLPS